MTRIGESGGFTAIAINLGFFLNFLQLSMIRLKSHKVISTYVKIIIRCIQDLRRFNCSKNSIIS